MSELACLHIDARRLQRLKLDGPALAITMAGAAVRLFPLRRLARVHITGIPDHGWEALMSCASQRIPVVFFNGNGHLQCLLYLPSESDTVLGHWLENRHTDARIADVFEQWQENLARHWQARMASFLRRKADIAATPLRQKATYLDQVLARLLRRRGLHVLWTQARPWLDGMLRAHLAQVIDGFGLNQHCREHRDLLNALEPPLQQMLRTECALWLLQERPSRLAGQALTALYEAEAECIDNETSRALWRLQYAVEKLI